MAEMVSYLPISSPFIRFAGRYVDEAFGVAAGYNFFVFEAALVPFEVTACNVIIHFWSEAVPAGGIIAIVLVLYLLINVLAVKWYGETEFWAALGKVLLIIGLIIYTFIVMVRTNPTFLHVANDLRISSSAEILWVIALASGIGITQAHSQSFTELATLVASLVSCNASSRRLSQSPDQITSPWLQARPKTHAE